MSPILKISLSVVAVAAVASMLVWGLSSGGETETSDPGSANPVSVATDYEAALAGAPKPLADLYADADAILEGGREKLDATLASVRGYPAIVNVWASWCGPCRFEFPFLQAQAAEHGKRVAFIGVDSDDSAEAAETFLEELPLPYPSVSDPDAEMFDAYKLRGLPGTAYYDESGELLYVHQGVYATEAQFAADIRRYATSG